MLDFLISRLSAGENHSLPSRTHFPVCELRHSKIMPSCALLWHVRLSVTPPKICIVRRKLLRNISTITCWPKAVARMHLRDMCIRFGADISLNIRPRNMDSCVCNLIGYAILSFDSNRSEWKMMSISRIVSESYCTKCQET